jgi:hypothetical protein
MKSPFKINTDIDSDWDYGKNRKGCLKRAMIWTGLAGKIEKAVRIESPLGWLKKRVETV